MKQSGEVWTFSPHRWDGKEWVNANTSCKDKLKSEFTILTWNVWFDTKNGAERMAAIGSIITNLNPDLIAMQEATPWINRILLAQEWARNYYVTDPTGSQFAGGYGVMLFSKVPFLELGLRNFPGRMGRKALMGSVMLENGQALLLGTFHLESYDADHPYRKLQLEMFQNIVSTMGFQSSILCGDTNFVLPDEHLILKSDYEDVWEKLYTRNSVKGFTFSTTVPHKRLDRIFVTKDKLATVEVKLVGTQPIVLGTQLFPSDHCGVFATLRCR